MRFAWLTVALAASLSQDPLKRIVQLLNDLSAQVQHEGEEEKRLYEKFMCWCSSGQAEEEEALAVQKARVERLVPAIEHANQQTGTLDDRIKEIEGEIDEHEQAARGAEALRSQEEEKYKSNVDVLKKAVSGLDKAIVVLKKQRDVNSLLQAGALVREALGPFAQQQRVRTVLDDRQVQALLQGSQESFLQSRAEFQSDHIIGVMEGLRMGFAHDLAETEKTEADSVAAYDALMTSKNKELVAARSTFRMLTEERTGLNAELARNRDDLAATQVSYAQDKAAYETRKKECGSKTQEFHARQQARLEEMLAINEAVQVLSADDTHVVFSKSVDKQALPQPGGLVEVSETSQVLSFLQLASTQAQVNKGDPHDVLKYVQELAKANPQHALLAQLAVKLEGMSAEGKFERVIQVISKQIEIIDMEQGEDDKKMTWCKDETARNKEAIVLKQKEKLDFEAQIGNTNADLTLLKDEAGSLAKEQDEIRRQLDDAGRQRGDERSSFDTIMAELKTAQVALVKAIQVLEGFYGQQSLLQQQSAAANAMRQQTQVNQLVDQQASAGSYAGKPATPDGEYQGAAGGRSILKLLGNIGQDLVHEEEARRASEKEAQATYDQLVAQTQVNMKLKQDQLLQRREQIARLEQTRDQFQSDSDDAMNLINELKARELDLAKNCYILDTYAKRKEMRGGERNAMEHAIQILS